MVLSFNLNALMKKLVFPESLKTKGMKGIRLYVIGVAGQFTQHAGSLLLKLSGGQETVDRIYAIRQRLLELAIPPPIESAG